LATLLPTSGGTRYGVTPDRTTLAGYWKGFERARPAINFGTFVGAMTFTPWL
jgi:hypothetical protein